MIPFGILFYTTAHKIKYKRNNKDEFDKMKHKQRVTYYTCMYCLLNYDHVLSVISLV